MTDFGPQFLAHRTGDFLLQNSFLALRKKQSLAIALLHGFIYTLPFCLLTQDWRSLFIIGGTHAAIDHWNLSSVWVRMYNWDWRSKTPRTPSWVMVEVDQTMHYIINYLALR